VDLAALRASDLAEAGRALAALVEVDLGDHLTFRLIRSTPTGLGENQPGVATRRYVFACIDADHDTQVDTVVVDVVVGPPPVGRPEVIEPVNRLHLRRPLITFPYRLYPVESVWSNLKRSLANLAKRDIAQLTALIKTRLRRMQYQRGLLEGFLAGTRLDLTPLCNPHS
jgi:hypothetical protein